MPVNFNGRRNNPVGDRIQVDASIRHCSVALHFSALSLRSLRLCVEAEASLVSRRRLPVQDLFEDVVLLQAVGFRVEVEEDSVAEDRDV